MNYFYITGTSRGIGKALAEKLLTAEDNFVTGISRTQSIEHQNYQHIHLDLSKFGESFSFGDHPDAGTVVLINNSGEMGQIGYHGSLTPEAIIRTHNLNFISPALLMNSFIAKYQDKDCKKVIVNIGSGAGRYPVHGWSGYCSSKAALDMISRVIHEEQNQKTCPVRVFSIAPGIVDTNMQDEIRLADEAGFPRLKEFLRYKAEGLLSTTDLAAAQILEIVENPERYPDVLLDVREL